MDDESDRYLARLPDHETWCRMMQGDWPVQADEAETARRKKERDEADAMRLLQEAAAVQDSIEFHTPIKPITAARGLEAGSG